ncbi:MAG TPA: TonB-dependent receptor, partial [Polyangia bacterium]
PERRTFGLVRRGVTDIGRTLTNLGLAGYGEVLWDVTSRLRLVPGLRFDWFHYSTTDKTSIDPRIVGRFTLQEGTAIKAGAGYFHQPPQPNQLDDQYGNPTLPVPFAHQYHLGIEHAFSPAISFDGTMYFMRKFDLPRPSSRALPDGSVERFAPHGRGRGYGLEVLLKHRPTNNFFGWIAYSLSRSEERRYNPTGVGLPSTSYVPTIFDQTHNLTVVGSRTLGAWELGARFRLVTGTPETPILGGQYDVDYNDWDPVTGETGSVRRQTFHQLDLRAERTFTFDTWRFSLYLDVQNVYNAENPEATVYDYRYRDRGPVRAEPPEVLIDLEAVMATGALAEPLPEITLMPLIVDPRGGGRPIQYRVQTCVVSPNEEARGGTQRPGRLGDTIGDAPCDPGAGIIAEGTAQAIAGGVVPLVVSFQPTLPLLIEAARVDPLGIELGLPITVTFTLTAGDQTVVAFKRIVFSRRLSASQIPNQSPVIGGFKLRRSRTETAALLDPKAAAPVSRGGRRLFLSVEPAVAETYPARNFSLAEKRFYTEQVPKETLRYSFYATRGVFSPGFVSNEPSPLRTNQVINYETVYEPPTDASEIPGPVDVYVVVRDERGGSSFARTQLAVE